MEKRHQVFVSSTFEDLREERKAIQQALLKMDCIPAGMQFFPASDTGHWELIKREIDRSDLYICIIAGRYGSYKEETISYTEAELNYAIKKINPHFSF